MQFLQDVRTRAAAKRRRIVFPESADVRTLAAVTALSRDGIVEPVLLLDPSRPESHRAARETGVEVVDITAPAIVERTVARLLERRAAKGLSEDEARRVARSAASNAL